MKNLIFLISIAFFVSCTSTQVEQETVVVEPATFSGTIANPGGDKIAIKGHNYSQEIDVNEDGTFSGELTVDPGYYTFKHNNEHSSFYLKPGDDLKLSLDTEEFDESISYSGTGANENNFIAAKYMFGETNTPTTKELYSLDEGDFLKSIDELRSGLMNLLKSTADLDETFIDNETKGINYDCLAQINNYQDYHTYFTEKEDFKVSADFPTVISELSMDNEEDYKLFGSYRDIVESNFFSDFDEESTFDSKLAALKSKESPSVINGLVKSLAYELKPGNDEAEAIYNGIMELSTDDKFKEKFTEKYEKVKVLAKGNVSPSFEYHNTEGENVSLASMKGKLVYVDVWATWCGPCKREIPHLKALEEEYRDKEIEFVSMSIDPAKDYQKWLDMVEEKEMKGVQIFADKDWKSSFVQEYAIEGIPRFILIDQEGNIISADAPRPSSDTEIKELIDANLVAS